MAWGTRGLRQDPAGSAGNASENGDIMTEAQSAQELHDRIAARLEVLAASKRGWFDGEGEPASPQALEAARRLAPEMPQAGIFLRQDGGISLQDRDGVVVINPDGSVDRSRQGRYIRQGKQA